MTLNKVVAARVAWSEFEFHLCLNLAQSESAPAAMVRLSPPLLRFSTEHIQFRVLPMTVLVLWSSLPHAVIAPLLFGMQ